MKTFKIEVPDQLAKEIEGLVQAGWFANDAIERAFHDGAAAHCPDVVCHFLDGREPEVRSGIWQAAEIGRAHV